jgi:hypothetical protein
MRTFAQRQAAVPELSQVVCNQCGDTVCQNEAGYFDDCLQVEKTWGYHSPMDGETHRFDLCADCYRQWVKGFLHPVL